MLLAHSLLSGALLLVPIAVTVGLYVGLNVQHIFHDGFKGSYGLPLEGPAPKASIQTYCQKSIGITPQPGRYTYNPNQWGLSAGEQSSLCMNITQLSGQSSTIASPFSATWSYPQGPDDEPVHAFPNAKLDLPSTLPVILSTFNSLELDVAWQYGVGNSNETASTDAQLAAANLNANVCVDMFFAADKTMSASTTNSSYEVMVWLGQYGESTQPIGLATGPISSKSVNGTTFALYSGTNGIHQKVFTWIAERNMTRFVGDIGPLINELTPNGGPQSSEYLGYIAFGSEALYSPSNVTFAVPELSIAVNSQ